MPKKKRSFNLGLSPTDDARLKKLEERLDKTRSQVIRDLINFAHAMFIEGRPTCATGMMCIVPHLHPKQPSTRDLQTFPPPLTSLIV